MKKFECPICGTELTDSSVPCHFCSCEPETLRKAEEEQAAQLKEEEERQAKYEETKIENTPHTPVYANPNYQSFLNSQPKQNTFSVNPKAEAVTDTIAKIVLGIHLFLSVAILVVGIIQIVDFDEFVGIILIATAILLAIVGIILWAGLKIIVNMSRTLYNINNAIRGKGVLIPEKKS